VQERNVRLCRDSRLEYDLAATAYRGYLERYPNNPQGYELHYNLADALYWSKNYEQAATEYAEVRDSNVDDSYLAESARRVVESLKRIADRDIEEGRLVIRHDAPLPTGAPPGVQPVAMPETVQRLARAREIYLTRVAPQRDTEAVRAAYDYNNALLLYWYGYWPQAEDRFTRIYEERCSGPEADATGQIAWENLRAMAMATEDSEEIRRLATDIQERGCTFSARADKIDCSRPANRDKPICRAGADLNALVYQDALDVYKRAGQATGTEQRLLYEQSATMLLAAVNRNPGDRQAPLALEYAALALEATNRFDSAAQLYQRIIDEVGPREAQDAEEQKTLDAILANAHFKLAYTASRNFDFDRAVENYRVLADSKRFAKSNDPGVQSKRADGLVNSAILLERLQRYPEATQYYRRVYDTVEDRETKRNALYRIAEMAYKQKRYPQAISAMREFIKVYGSDGEAGDLVVQAYWRIAESWKARGRMRDYQSALAEVTTAFDRTGQPPGSMAAGYAAEARFILVDGKLPGFEKFQIRPGKPKTVEAYVNAITKQIGSGGKQAQSIADGYEPVFPYRRPRWTIASYVRQGRAYEVLARSILNTPIVLPLDLQRAFRQADPYEREDLQLDFEDKIRQVLDNEVRPIECFAVARYALAARAGRAGSFDDQYTRVAASQRRKPATPPSKGTRQASSRGRRAANRWRFDLGSPHLLSPRRASDARGGNYDGSDWSDAFRRLWVQGPVGFRASGERAHVGRRGVGGAWGDALHDVAIFGSGEPMGCDARRAVPPGGPPRDVVEGAKGVQPRGVSSGRPRHGYGRGELPSRAQERSQRIPGALQSGRAGRPHRRRTGRDQLLQACTARAA
jgi:tetratricopeptide (TPR) repeat protein